MKRKHRNHHRHTLLKALEHNGGYRTRREHYLLEWCLPVYANKGFDALLLLALGPDFTNMDSAVIPVWRAAYAEELEAVKESYEAWADSPNNGTNEEMWQDFKYDDHYRTHPVTNKLLDCTWELEGRGGKHLVLTEFERRGITGNAAELLGLDEGCDPAETKITNAECRTLLDMIAFWDTTLTQKKVTAEYEFRLADFIHQDIQDRGML